MADPVEIPEAAAEAPPAAAEPAAAPGKDWSKVLILAGQGDRKPSDKRPVIVCEQRTDDGKLVDREVPKNADVYYTADADANFADADGTLVLGKNVEQGLLWGLSSTQGVLHVGPAHPAYGAVNVGYLKGREAGVEGTQEFEIVGLSDGQKRQLRPWFDAIAKDPRAPADVKVTLT